MNDAIALLAISQLVCIGAIFYLFMQLQSVRREPVRVRRPRPVAGRVEDGRQAAAQAARQAYGRPTAPELAARAVRSEADVASLARRMNRSEEEVRLLLRRQGALR